jgi:hypothetical protein
VCRKNCGEGYYMYLYIRTSRILERKKGKTFICGCIHNLVCFVSDPVKYNNSEIITLKKLKVKTIVRNVTLN